MIIILLFAILGEVIGYYGFDVHRIGGIIGLLTGVIIKIIISSGSGPSSGFDSISDFGD